MDQTASILHATVAAVCPIDGVSVGDPLDKTTWRIDFSSSAAAAQIADANALVASLTPPLRPTVLSALDFWNRFTPAEQAAVSVNPALQIFIVTALAIGSVDLANPETKQGLDAAVQAGAITNDRETTILTP